MYSNFIQTYSSPHILPTTYSYTLSPVSSPDLIQWDGTGPGTIFAQTLMTVTRNLFSSSSCIAPLMEPIAQHSCVEREGGGGKERVRVGEGRRQGRGREETGKTEERKEKGGRESLVLW